MTLEERMKSIEKAFGAHSDLVIELRNAVTVTAQMEARQARLLREHSDWLAGHDEAKKEHEERMNALDACIAALDN